MPISDRLFTIKCIALAVIATILAVSCTTTEHTFVEITDDSLYRSHTQSEFLTKQIDESFKSVKRILSTVFYRTYQFDIESPPLKSQVRNADLNQLALQTTTDNHSSAGSAVVLARSSERVGLLTAAHVVTFQDTIWHYVKGYGREGNVPVEAVSVKERLNYFVYGQEDIGLFELVVSDTNRDLALLSTRLGAGDDSDLVPLSVKPGDSNQLDWADLVYALGYPKGYRMVTSGIVSRQATPRRQGFVVDASFNRGFSGGIVFAVRNDETVFEWVGVLTSAAADVEYILTPGHIPAEDYDPDLEYTGAMYVSRQARINYGITHAVSIEEVKEFFRENERVIRRNGFSPRDFPR
jgi:S1-C subfamily serine protease